MSRKSCSNSWDFFGINQNCFNDNSMVITVEHECKSDLSTITGPIHKRYAYICSHYFFFTFYPSLNGFVCFSLAFWWLHYHRSKIWHELSWKLSQEHAVFISTVFRGDHVSQITGYWLFFQFLQLSNWFILLQLCICPQRDVLYDPH